MSTISPPRSGVILVNLGTPDAPTPSAVRRFLRLFLSDPRVVEMPRPLWWLILHLFILPFRPYRVARLYQTIWEEGGSPMRRLLEEQRQALALHFEQETASQHVEVLPAMTYGLPSLEAALDTFRQNQVENVVVLPLLPQYSATSTAPVYDVVQRWSKRQRNLPTLSIIKDYHTHPLYIEAIAQSIREHRAQHGESARLLFSFHGIPQPYADKGDPYPQQCLKTAELVAAALGLPRESWAYSFQSRFGAQQWIQPYTDVLLHAWAKGGIESVQVVCPGFAADCLETLEEIAIQNRDGFLQAGGKRYEYIPALNASANHIRAMATILQPYIQY